MDLSYGLMLLTGDPTTYKEATPYAPGAVGKFFMLPADKTVFGLTAGNRIFQLVKVTSVTGYVQGAPLYWTSQPDVKEVTTAPTNAGLIAGVGVNTAAQAPAANDHVFMQVRGRSKAFKKASSTAAAVATGDAFAVRDATAGQVDVITTGPTAAQSVLGRTVEVLAAATAGLVQILLTVELHP